MKRHSNIPVFIPNLGCKNRCVFCDQRTVSSTIKEPESEEVSFFLEKSFKEKKFPADTEIAFFGGSFTALERNYMISLLEAASRFIESKKALGIRISTRPDAIDEDILKTLKEYGVSSIELGAQSMDDGILHGNMRGHTSADVFRSSLMIKNHGFSLGLQMMLGMYMDENPGKTAYDTAEKFIQIKPDTVRIYPTVVLKGTKLEELYNINKYIPLSLESAVKICGKLLLMFFENGIQVIRAGLHSDTGLVENIAAGPFHPAFGELARSGVYMDLISEKLKGKDKGSYILYVAKGCVGAAVGINKINSEYFSSNGYLLKVVEKDTLREYEAETG